MKTYLKKNIPAYRFIFENHNTETESEKSLERKWTTTPEGRSKLYADASRYVRSEEAKSNPKLKADLTKLVNDGLKEEKSRKEYAVKAGKELFRKLREHQLFINPDDESELPKPVEPPKPAEPSDVEKEKLIDKSKDVLSKIMPEDNEKPIGYETAQAKIQIGSPALEQVPIYSFQQKRYVALKENIQDNQKDGKPDTAVHARAFYDFINNIFSDKNAISDAEKKSLIGKTRTYNYQGISTTVSFREATKEGDTQREVILEVTSKGKSTTDLKVGKIYYEDLSRISSHAPSVKSEKNRIQSESPSIKL